jgi:hypothetical protein
VIGIRCPSPRLCKVASVYCIDFRHSNPDSDWRFDNCFHETHTPCPGSLFRPSAKETIPASPTQTALNTPSHTKRT